MIWKWFLGGLGMGAAIGLVDRRSWRTWRRKRNTGMDYLQLQAWLRTKRRQFKKQNPEW